MTPQRSTGALPPSRLRERRRRARNLQWITFSLLFVLLVGALIGVMHLKRIRVGEVAISQTKTLDAGAVEHAVREELAGNYFYVFPKDNVLLYSPKHIEERLLGDYPKIKSVKVALKNFHAIEVSVEERIPVALWCGGVQSADSSHPCFFLDESGYAYAQAPEYSGNAYIQWYGETALPNPPAGYLSPDVFRSLHFLMVQLKNDAGEPLRVFVDSNGDVRVAFKEGFDLLFTVMQKPEEVLTHLRTAKSTDVLQGKKLSALLYLDLRFGSKMYYKFK